uniref:hypothetical protein n=1 Tax=uncultured Erythrobacter sp. TaxID=263913 RepID=UPI00262775B6|nr:hypothetical protein [uncultured Erythrobacter sp.]
MFHALESLAMIAMASASVPLAQTAPTLCKTDETSVFYGQVRDDFGLDVAVCFSGDKNDHTVTVRWEGEGGGAAVSCRSSECDGHIEYSRYTSPHLTILQLAWRKDGSIQRVYQTLERAGPGEVATHTTSHSWESAGAASSDVTTYKVVSDGEPLQLMRLEGVVPTREWATPLLSKALQ